MRLHSALSALLLLGAAGACSAVLGIEELESGKQETPTGGTSASGGSGAATGGVSTDAGKTGGGTSASGGAVSSGGSSTGGSSPLGGAGGEAPSEGQGGEGVGQGGEGVGQGGAPSIDGPVRGKVIDFWGHALPNVPVSIAGQSTLTGDDGSFEIDDVTPPYDVSLRIETKRLAHAWVYQGLTRLDPTLQVGEGSDSRNATITFHATGAMHDEPNSVAMAIGSDDGSFAMSMSGPQVQSSWSWYGPATTAVTGHALWWTESQNSASPGPEAFLGYGTAAGSMTDSVAGEIMIELGSGEVAATTVQGSVTRGIEEYPTNMVSLRFADNAVIDLVNLTPEGPAFAYQVPELPDAEVVVAASQGDPFSGPYGVAYRVADGGPVNLSPPMPVTVITPGAEASNVDEDTTFEWSARPGVRVLHIEDTEFYRALFVVTDATKITLPEAIGFELRPGARHYWTVEVHGTAESVDEATGPDGFLDSYSIYDDSPRGPRRGDGTYSYSGLRMFTTAP